MLLSLVGGLWPTGAWAIPVFARIYGKPCGTCHTIYPELNPVGELFRASGLHGLPTVVEPLHVFPGFDVPGTLPAALALGVGEDISRNRSPGRPSPTETHFNLEFLSILAGGELGSHLAFLADYAPLYSIPQTGELYENTRVGLGFLQAHAEPGEWLVNLRAGLFELPLGASPRVHRLLVQPYQIYNVSAFSLLGRAPPVSGSRTDSLSLSSTQIGAEISGFDRGSGLTAAAGVTNGSNNRADNNGSKDVYLRLGEVFGFHRAGLFLYYSPDVIGAGATDWALRLGPDVNLYWRRASVKGEFLAGYDSNPTGRHESLWYYGTFAEAEYRWTPALASLARVEYTGMPTFSDTDQGGGVRLRRELWQLTGGLQWLLFENLKLLAEGTYGENHEEISSRSSDNWLVTLRMQTAFWPLTPPGLEKVF